VLTRSTAICEDRRTRFHYVTPTADRVADPDGPNWIAWRKFSLLSAQAAASSSSTPEVSVRATSRWSYDLDTAATRPACLLEATNLATPEESTSSPMTSGRGSRTPTLRISSGCKTTGADRVEHSRSYRFASANSEQMANLKSLAICVQSAERSRDLVKDTSKPISPGSSRRRAF